MENELVKYIKEHIRFAEQDLQDKKDDVFHQEQFIRELEELLLKVERGGELTRGEKLDLAIYDD